MSYFDDQEDAWFANNCQGEICDVNPYDEPSCSDDVSRPVRLKKNNFPVVDFLKITLDT